ncbi:MAG TPA: S8 family serine peptidase [Haliscomenobacter sp.]|uniref:S8 family serine peptidase n=1 Tax=Haliscomenobacter sp. TaxID=2717303 RepID=UPI002B5CCA39|nr:S8 family serine peptidase [Haliscomenobacter sp.]HOY19246.1 S8 family serine peptidase [Haliscomenobacter sp.]HPH18279.1 S8 family serine peptidase [Haliscomenobacter sp.]
MRKFILLFIYVLFLVHSLFAQIVPPPPSGYFDLIIVFPLDAQPAAIEAVRRDFNAIQLAITPVTQARLWRMTTSFKSPLTSPLGSYSYSDPLDAVERVRGRTSGVGTGGTAIQISTPTRLPEVYAPKNIKKLPYAPLLSSCMAENDFLISDIGVTIVKVAIMDTGLECDLQNPILFKHPSLSRFVAVNDRRNFTTDYPENLVNDKHGHGTGVASVIVRGFERARKYSSCRIVPIKVLNNAGEGTLYALIQGIDHAIQKNVDIINISVISPDKTIYKGKTPIELAIQKAEVQGILVVSAAGNDSRDIDLPENRLYPACTSNPNQLVVGAGGCSGSLAYFANFGKTSVDIFAPGERIIVYGLADTFNEVDGSSFAAPIVTGIAAALRTHSPTRNWKPLDCAIRSGVTLIPAFSGKCTTGGGVHSGRARSGLGSCR